MLKKFATAMEGTVKKEKTFTENGALSYKTSGTALVDFNFKMSSYRIFSEEEIASDFSGVYSENPILAVKMLFFAGDIRGGMGERRVFNTCLKWLAENHSNIANAIIDLIPEYNRWDAVVNLFFLKGTKEKAFDLISSTLHDDIRKMNNGESISLLAKWMPSINTSSKEAVKKALSLKDMLGYDNKKYRKILSKLRKYLDVTEVKMSSNNWKWIDYEKVPSKANIIYKNAFMKHDKTRRSEYLDKLSKGEAKINSGVAFPYDIVHSYYDNIFHKDETLEGMWKSLPDYLKGNGSDTICMVDGSYSMTTTIGRTSLTCMEVAQSLGIYFAERMNGSFNNKFITFSREPQLVSFNKNWALRDKILECRKYTECANTDIYKAFKLILNVAKNNNLKQEEIPQNILVLSDMEFDSLYQAS